MTCLKVNFCAPPGSLKSTVAVGVEAFLKQKGIITDTSKEFAREYFNEFGVPKELFEQMIIREKQEGRDKDLASVSQIMLSDYPVVNPYVFGVRMLEAKLKEKGRKQPSPAEYNFLNYLHEKVLKKINWFDIIIVFPPSELIVQDGTRQESKKEADDIFKAITGFLNVHNVPYYFIDGDSQERIDKSCEIILDAYNKK